MVDIDIEQPVPEVLALCSGILIGWIIVDTLFRIFGVVSVGVDQLFLATLVSTVPAIVAIFAAAVWVGKTPIDPSFCRYVVGWICLFTIVFVGSVLTVAVVLLSSTWDQMVAVRWAVSFGVGTGAVVGSIHSLSLHHAVERHETVIENQQLRKRRELLDYLNSLLRHEVLNTANVIQGHASILEDRLAETEGGLEHVEIIDECSEDLIGVITDVQVLLSEADGNATVEKLELAPILHEEVERVNRQTDGGEFVIDIPPSLSIEATDLIKRVFANLFANAVEYNDHEVPNVRVKLESISDDAVTISVEDNGVGISTEEREGLFDRSEASGDSHGLGLFITQTLIDRYQGDITLNETGPSGTVFHITLPRA